MSYSVQSVAGTRATVALAIARVLVPVAGLSGLVLLALAVITRAWDTAIVGMALGVVASAALIEMRRVHPRPLTVPIVAVTGLALAVPFISHAEAMALLPAIGLFAFAGAFSMRRPVALRFGLWCGAVAMWTILWHLGDLTAPQVVVVTVLVGATGAAGWRLLVTAGDEVSRQDERHRLLFDGSPVALLEEDFTEVDVWLNGLRSGVKDLRTHLSEHPDQARHGISLITIRRANQAAARMTGARSPEDLVGRFGDVPRADVELDGFVEQFLAIWEGRRELALDLHGQTFGGRELEAVLHWSVPTGEGGPDLSRVMVAISDITPRQAIEQRLADALEANRRLLGFEQALASCSRALLLGVGEDALEVALETLRAAIGADRAFLAVNLEDPVLGPSFRVVNSASIPDYADDDWVGMVVPWSKYPMAEQPLKQGEAFQHQAAPRQGEGWRRSLLAVPVHTSGDWTGIVGFIDVGRRTVWSEEAVRMLEVAAPMLGSFWERETTRLRLEELVQSKDRFVASVSHELRTPLAAVLGFAEELRANASSFQPHEAVELMELIAEQSRDMADLVEDLLVGARADIGTISIHPQEVFLRSQAEAALVALGSTLGTTITVVGGPGRAWADPARTRQIIRNLLTNAVRYGGDEVVVEARDEAAKVSLSVGDNGAGLPPAEWERIFEPYQRAHERPTQPASVGLGLTVSRQLARVMGGDLTYRSDAEGSLFELTLPVTPDEGTGSQRASETGRSGRVE